MIFIDSTTKKLRLRLGEAIATAEAQWNGSYVKIDNATQEFVGGVGTRGTSIGTAAVDLVPAPIAGQLHKVALLTLVNLDTIAHGVSVFVDDAAVEFLLGKFALSIGDQLQYADGEGWRVFDSTGKLKVLTGGGAPADAQYLVGVADLSLTAERVVTDTPTVAWDLATPAQAKANVPNDAITFAKVQNVASARVLGRTTAGAGDVEELSAGAGISIAGGQVASTVSQYTDEQAQDAVGFILTDTPTIDFTYDDVTPAISAVVPDDAITNAKAANMAANTVKANPTAGAADPQDLAVGANSVVGRVAGNVVAAQLVTAQVADKAIDNAKLRDSGAASVVGRSAGSIGNPADISAAADGDVLRRAGGALGFGVIHEASVTNLVADLAARVLATRAINTTAPISGGGDLSADRTHILDDNGITNAKLRDSAAFSVIGKGTAGVGDPGDIVAADETVFGRTAAGNLIFAPLATGQVAADAITNAKLANVASASFKGRITAAVGDPEDMTGTQATTLLDLFTAVLKGLVPASGGGVANFLRADGTWASPGGGAGAITTVNAQKFLTPGAFTYPPTAGMKFCIIFCTGAGGGGGAAKTNLGGSRDVGIGGGGASGATWIGIFSAAEIGASVAGTIGAGGTIGAAATGGNGGAGGSSSMTGLGTAGGGFGGSGSGDTTQDAQNKGGGVTPGTNTGLLKASMVNLCGQIGFDGWACSSTDSMFGESGNGAASFWGGGGVGTSGAQISLVADFVLAGRSPGFVGQPSRPGAGGSGAINFTSATGFNGGAGADGMVYIIEFI